MYKLIVVLSDDEIKIDDSRHIVAPFYVRKDDDLDHSEAANEEFLREITGEVL